MNDKDIKKIREDMFGNEWYEIDDLPLTELQKMCVLEWMAKKYWRIQLDLDIQDGHCKTYDPLVIDGNIAHSYVYDLNTGGRHHPFTSLNELEGLFHNETVERIKEEYNRDD